MNNDVLLINNTPVQDTVLVPVTAVQADLVTQTDTIVYVPLASKTAPGIVQIGSGLTISDKGLLEFDAAEVTIKKILKNGKEIEIVDKTVNITIDKNDVGLSNVDNTADKDKEISDKAMAKFNALEASLSKNISDVNSDLTAHTTNIANPHKVTKTQVGLDRVDNTADKDKPVSTATRNALDALDNKHTNKSDSILAALDDHKANVANPHKVTKSQIGLGNVDNTSDLNKPVSRPVRSELDKLQKQIKGATNTVSYDSYEELVEDVNTLEPNTYFVGQSVYVLTKNVPDLWIYKIHDTPVEFEYKSDADFIKKLTDNDSIQIGYYSFAALETLKVNLDNYVTLDGTQVITGDKNFSGALQQNGKDVALEEDLDNYLPLSGGSGKCLTGPLYVKSSDVSVWSGSTGIIFDSGASIGSLNTGTLGIKAKGSFYVRIGDTTEVNIDASSVRPSSKGGSSLGTSSYQWLNLYATNVYQDGKPVANQEDVPTEYIKDATVTDNTLTLTKADSTTLNFNGGPTSYIQDATVADDVLTITKSDGSTLAFEGGKPPEVDLSGYLPLSAGSGKQLTGVLYTKTGTSVWSTSEGIRLANQAYIVGNDGNEIGIRSSNGIYCRIGETNHLAIQNNLVRPGVNATINLGNTNYKWNEIHGTTIYQSGKQVANKDDIPDTSVYFEKIGGAISGDLKLSQTKGVYVTIDNIDYPLVMNTTDGTTYGSASLTTNITGDTINFAKLPQVNGTNLALSSDLSNYVTTNTAQKIEGAKAFTGQVGNIQTEAGVYLGLDTNAEAPNANMAITSANSAAYIDMGRPNVDYDFRIIKWNTADNKHAQLVYGGNASGAITIPQASGVMALTSDIPAKVAESNPNVFIGYNSTENANSGYQVSFKNNDQAQGICWSKFANYSNTSYSPGACTFNGFFYAYSSVNSLSGADSNPFLQYHSEADFRILTTAYNESWIQQIATDFRTDHIYYRRRENGTWTNWTKVGGGSGLSLNNWQITESSSKLVFSLK